MDECILFAAVVLVDNQSRRFVDKQEIVIFIENAHIAPGSEKGIRRGREKFIGQIHLHHIAEVELKSPLAPLAV
jgi:hypothetical protein